jgi:hypothetical protein
MDSGVPSLVTGFAAVAIVFWLIALALTIFWIWAMVDAVTHEPTTNDKILWFLVIFFLHFIGALIYVLVRRGARARPIT